MIPFTVQCLDKSPNIYFKNVCLKNTEKVKPYEPYGVQMCVNLYIFFQK